MLPTGFLAVALEFRKRLIQILGILRLRIKKDNITDSVFFVLGFKSHLSIEQ